MLEWSIPEAEDEDWINRCIAVSGTMASDASLQISICFAINIVQR